MSPQHSQPVAYGKALRESGFAERAVQHFETAIPRMQSGGSRPAEIACAHLEHARGLRELGRAGAAIAAVDDALNEARKDTVAGERCIAGALVIKGRLLNDAGRVPEALGAYDQLLADCGDAADPPVRAQLATALLDKALIEFRAQRFEQAVILCDALLDRFGGDGSRALELPVAVALQRRIASLDALGRLQEAAADADELVARYGTSGCPSVVSHVAGALATKARILGDRGEDAQAVRVLDDLLARYSQATELDLRIRVAVALRDRGYHLEATGRGAEARESYDEIIERVALGTHPILDEVLAWARGRRAAANALAPGGLTAAGDVLARLRRLDRLSQHEEVVALVDRVLPDGEQLPDLASEEWADILIGKARALQCLWRARKAIEVYDRIAAASDRDPSAKRLRRRAVIADIERSRCLLTLGLVEDALTALDGAVLRAGTDADLETESLEALVAKLRLVTAYGRADDALPIADSIIRSITSAGRPPALQHLLAEALVTKAGLLAAMLRPADAAAALEDVAHGFPAGGAPSTRRWVGVALHDLAGILSELGRHAEAAQYRARLLRGFADETLAALGSAAGRAGLAGGALSRQQAAAALLAKAQLLIELDRIPQARSTLGDLVARHAQDEEPAVAAVVAKAAALRRSLVGGG